MEITAIIISIALLQYILFVIRVGLSRNKYNVQAPRTTGNEIWERLFRIQQNTLEQLVIFIPGMVIFTMYVSETWALLPGILFILGRQIYSGLYLKDPRQPRPWHVSEFLEQYWPGDCRADRNRPAAVGLISLGLAPGHAGEWKRADIAATGGLCNFTGALFFNLVNAHD